MEKVKSKILKEILESRRSRFNTAFAMARQVKINLDPDAFTQYFVLFAEQLVKKNIKTDKARLEQIIVELYDAVLELCVKDLLGSSGKYPFFEKALCTLMDHFADDVSGAPGEFIAPMTNILLNLAESDEELVDQWLERIIKIDDGSGLNSLLECGLVCAWRCGMARYRDAALEYAGTIPRGVFAGIFDLDPGPVNGEQQKKLVAGMKVDPWIVPGNILAPPEENTPEIRIVGNFNGYGGQFKNPPRIFADNDTLVAYDGERFFQLYADIFGQEIIRLEKSKKPRGTKPKKDFCVDNSGSLVFRDRRFPLPESIRVQVSGQAAVGTTLCFTSKKSHKLFILGVAGQ